MKLRVLLLTVLSIGMSVSALAQCPDRYRGVAREYPFDELTETPAPKGYKPVYISHYGRHGQRYSTDAKVYDVMMQALQAGHDSSALTAYGEEVYCRYLRMYPELQGHNGDLCRTGEIQQQKLADRMVDTYPGIFKGKVKVDACSSIVPRAIVSMASFCTELQKRCPKADISQRSYSSEMLRLNGIDMDNPMMKLPVFRKALARIYSHKEASDSDSLYVLVLKPFFSDVSVLDSLGGGQKVATSMMEAVLHMPESSDKMDDIFPEKVWEHKWMAGNAGLSKMYIEKIDSMSLFGCMTYTLMDDFIEQKSKDMQDGVSVRLRFGHDMILMGLLSLMQVDDWAQTMDESNVPMASNFRMVVYTKKGAEDLVKFIYNDKECRLPIQSDIAPYYKWSDVATYCSYISSRVSGLREK